MERNDRVPYTLLLLLQGLADFAKDIVFLVKGERL